MKTIRINGQRMIVPDEGKLLAVYYKDDPEPVFYERIAEWLIGEDEQVVELEAGAS